MPMLRKRALKRAERMSEDASILFEVFIQYDDGKAHQHGGSVRADDAEMALQNARDVFARRENIKSIWVVPSASITASQPGESGPFFDGASDKVYRHPQFYSLPDNLKDS